MTHSRPSTFAGFLVAAWVAGVASAAGPATEPSLPHPLLDQLSHETVSVYADVQRGMVRVQLPPPKWADDLADKDCPLNKYPDLNPGVREQLQRSRTGFEQGDPVQVVHTVVVPATQPAAPVATSTPANPASANPTPWRVTSPPGSGEIIFESPGANAGTALQLRAGGAIDADGQIARGPGLQLSFPAASNFSPNNVGLLLDDQGHVLVPIYLEPGAISSDGVKVMVGDNALGSARFVASDEQTQLTVLQLDKPLGKPVQFAAARPADGSLVLMLSPNTGAGRLEIWTGGEGEWGVVVGTDGRIAGFDRYGQFLGGASFQSVVHQLIANRRVKRATVGISVNEFVKTDPQRQTLPALGSRPALRVTAVIPHSPADQAGLKPGDLILALADDPVGDTPTFAALLSARNGPTPLRVLRDGQTLTLSLNLHPD